jgi:hypothetical protein
VVPTSLVPMVSDLTVLHSYICLPLPGGLEVKKSPHNFNGASFFLFISLWPSRDIIIEPLKSDSACTLLLDQ